MLDHLFSKPHSPSVSVALHAIAQFWFRHPLSQHTMACPKKMEKGIGYEVERNGSETNASQYHTLTDGHDLVWTRRGHTSQDQRVFLIMLMQSVLPWHQCMVPMSLELGGSTLYNVKEISSLLLIK
jgi:hypothetical protein